MPGTRAARAVVAVACLLGALALLALPVSAPAQGGGPVAPARGQTPAAPAPPPPAALPSPAATASAPALREADRAFLLAAAASSLLYVDASRVVEQRAEDPLVKAHAALLARDHAASLAELRALALARGLTLPDASPPERRSVVEALQALPPLEMAQRYVQQLVLVGHEADIRLYRTMADSVGDPELVAWARQALPVLQQHLLAARQLPVTLQA